MISLILGTYDAFPFYTGVISTAENVPPTTVSLGGRIYPIDLRNYRHSSQETLRDGAVVQAETSDSLFNANGAWSRYRHEWSHGAGQDVADFSEDTDERRFDTATGVVPWETGLLTLQNSVESVASISSSIGMMVSNDKLYRMDGSDLYYSTDGTSWTTATAPGGTIQGLTTDGTDLYVATTTVLKKYLNSSPGTPVDFTTPVAGDVSHVRFVGNRLLCGIGASLYEIGSAGTQTLVKTHFQSAFRWTVIFALGSRIYAGGYAGSRSELYVLETNSSGNLVVGQEAAPFPAGELLYRAEAYAGIAAVGTSRGLRLIQQSGDGSLSYGPLYSDFGAVLCMTFANEFLYVGVTNHPSGGKGIAQLKLDTMVAPLQPAYCYSLYADTQTGNVSCLVRFLDRLFFGVSGVAVYRQLTDEYVLTGEIDSGELYFGTVEEKILTEMYVSFEPLLAGQAVKAEVLDDNGTVIASGQESGVGKDEMAFTIEGIRIHHVQVRITLTGTSSTTPAVHFWRLRAYPVPPAVYQWVVPLIIHTRVIVSGGMGQEYSMNVLDEAGAIRDWFTNKERITYQEGLRVYRVRVDAYELQPADWTDDGGFFQHTMVVRLVSA